MFEHVADFYAASAQKMDFVWHGGEPLLHEPACYEQIFSLQHQFFDPKRIPFQNSIQTNLVSLKRDTIEFLRNNFENIGVSIDLFGNLRVAADGRPSQPKVLENIQQLIDAEVRFGCITVLSKATAPLVREIFDFFYELGIAFRLFPIYRTGFAQQHEDLGLTDTEIVDAFKKVADLWFEMDGLLQIRPIQDYVTNVVRRYAGSPLCGDVYSKRKGESLFIIDTDGGVYSNADAYAAEFCYGNIFSSSMHTLLRSTGYSRSVSSSEQRMSLTCAVCDFHGGTDEVSPDRVAAAFVGEATAVSLLYGQICPSIGH